MKKVAIIGGGAAGLIASVVLARRGVKVDIFEQNSKLGKKILVSGNGHCNISNIFLDAEHYTSDNPRFVESTLKRFGFAELEKFMNSVGMLLYSKEDGRAYPLSYEAKSVLNAFEEVLSNLHVDIFYEHKIESIKKEEFFTLTCKSQTYEGYDAVVVATGLQAAPQLGANDDGLRFATSFEHTVIPTYPSLVGLHLDSPYHEHLFGVKINGEAAIYVDRIKEKTVKGDILFTKYGVSGLAVLDISQIASKALLHCQNVEISLNLLSELNPQSIASQILNLCKAVPENKIETVLNGVVHSKLASMVLKAVNINADLLALHVNTKMVKSIVNKLQNWRFKVVDTHGFAHAEVAGGGVDTCEIDEKSFESKKAEGLYFVGELLDVTGERGGYNFQFAFASGHLCAEAICKNFSRF